MGLFLGFGHMVTTVIDHADADLWVMPRGTKCFEDPSLLDARKRTLALQTLGVADAVPLIIGFSDWRLSTGSLTPVFVVGTDLKAGALLPWNVVAGNVSSLSAENAVAVDRSYFERLGVSKLGDTAQLRNLDVQVTVLTEGIRSFTTTPYVFLNIDRARGYTGTASDEASYVLVRLQPKANLEEVRSNLLTNISNVEVLTSAEFAERSREFWLFSTGAGAALFAGALLGVIVGTVIVAQTLYSSTKDHLNEFATLRAIGSSRRYIYKVIIWQAMLNAVIGFAIAMLIGFAVVTFTAATALPILVTPGLILALFALTVLMCVGSAMAAIVKVTRIDPAMVFTR
jgi:putative ABC transport system permease protein